MSTAKLRKPGTGSGVAVAAAAAAAAAAEASAGGTQQVAILVNVCSAVLRSPLDQGSLH